MGTAVFSHCPAVRPVLCECVWLGIICLRLAPHGNLIPCPFVDRTPLLPATLLTLGLVARRVYLYIVTEYSVMKLSRNNILVNLGIELATAFSSPSNR